MAAPVRLTLEPSEARPTDKFAHTFDGTPARTVISVHSDPIETMNRWTESGAVWRVVSRRNRALTIGLFRCDGGEEVERITSSDPELIAFVGDRASSEE